VQPAAPAPAPAKAPTIVLRLKALSGAHSAASTKRLKKGDRFKVFGRVVGVKGGRLVLTFQGLRHGKWRNAFGSTLRVKANGSFRSTRLKALKRGSWRVQGQYTSSAKLAKSRFVYFKI